MLAEEMKACGLHACHPLSNKPDGWIGYPGDAEEVLEALRPRLHVSVTVSVRTHPRASPSSKRVRLCWAERQRHVAKGETTVTGRLVISLPTP